MVEGRIERKKEGHRQAFWIIYEGKPVSRLWVHDLKMRFGATTLRVGGIGGVRTEEPYRRRGFARRLLEAADEAMRQEGFDLAALFGIPDFYERWGYVPALPEYYLTIPTENLPPASPHYCVVNFTREHRPAILRIYTDNNKDRICSIVRRSETWTGFVRGTGWSVGADVKVFLDDGEPIGYLSLDDTQEHTAVAEVGFVTTKVFESMAALIAQRARQYGHEEITLAIPPDHPFAIYLRRYGCITLQRYARSGGGMMRIINLESTMRKMSLELTRRWQTSSNQGWEGQFDLVTDIGSVLITIEMGRVQISPLNEGRSGQKVELPQGKLTQLLTGYQSIETLITDPDVRFPSSLLPALRALFPPASPYIWWADRF